jgi:hypothetical protein
MENIVRWTFLTELRIIAQIKHALMVTFIEKLNYFFNFNPTIDIIN